MSSLLLSPLPQLHMLRQDAAVVRLTELHIGCLGLSEEGRAQILHVIQGSQPYPTLHPSPVWRNSRSVQWQTDLSAPTVLVAGHPTLAWYACMRSLLVSLLAAGSNSSSDAEPAEYSVVLVDQPERAETFLRLHVTQSRPPSIDSFLRVVDHVPSPAHVYRVHEAKRYWLTRAQKLTFMFLALLHPDARHEFTSTLPHSSHRWLSDQGRSRLFSLRSTMHHFIKHLSIGPDDGVTRMERIGSLTYMPSPCDESGDAFIVNMGRKFDELLDTSRMRVSLKVDLEQECVNESSNDSLIPDLRLHPKGVAFLQVLVLWTFYRASVRLKATRDIGFLTFVQLALVGQLFHESRDGTTAVQLAQELSAVFATGTFNVDSIVFTSVSSRGNRHPISHKRFMRLLIQLAYAATSQDLKSQQQQPHASALAIHPCAPGLVSGTGASMARHRTYAIPGLISYQQFKEEHDSGSTDQSLSWKTLPAGWTAKDTVALVLPDAGADDLQPVLERLWDLWHSASELSLLLPVAVNAQPSQRSALHEVFQGRMGSFLLLPSQAHVQYLSMYSHLTHAPHSPTAAAVLHDALMVGGPILQHALLARELLVWDVQNQYMVQFLPTKSRDGFVVGATAYYAYSAPTDLASQHKATLFGDIEFCRLLVERRISEKRELGALLASDRFYREILLAAVPDDAPIQLVRRYFNGTSATRWMVFLEGLGNLCQLLPHTFKEAFFECMDRLHDGRTHVQGFARVLEEMAEGMKGMQPMRTHSSRFEVASLDVLHRYHSVPIKESTADINEFVSRMADLPCVDGEDANDAMSSYVFVDEELVVWLLRELQVRQSTPAVRSDILWCLIPVVDVFALDLATLFPPPATGDNRLRISPLGVSSIVPQPHLPACSSQFAERIRSAFGWKLEPSIPNPVDAHRVCLMTVSTGHMFQSALFSAASVKLLSLNTTMNAPKLQASMRVQSFGAAVYSRFQASQLLQPKAAFAARPAATAAGSAWSNGQPGGKRKQQARVNDDDDDNKVGESTMDPFGGSTSPQPPATERLVPDVDAQSAYSPSQQQYSPSQQQPPMEEDDGDCYSPSQVAYTGNPTSPSYVPGTPDHAPPIPTEPSHSMAFSTMAMDEFEYRADLADARQAAPTAKRQRR